MSRYTWVAHERATIIGTTRGTQATAKARRLNLAIDHELEAQREEWVLIPPSSMTIILHQDAGALPGGVVLSVGHEIGRVLLHKRLAAIIERNDVRIAVVIEGSIEDAIEAMNQQVLAA